MVLIRGLLLTKELWLCTFFLCAKKVIWCDGIDFVGPESDHKLALYVTDD